MSRERQPTLSSDTARHCGRLGLLVALTLGVALVVVACGGGSSGEGDASSGVIQADDLAQQAQEADTPAAGEGEQAAAESGATESSSAATVESTEEIEPEDVFLAFAQCLREEGLAVSDPDFSSGRGPGGFLRGVDRDDPDVQAALETCRPLIENARPEVTPEEQAERQDQLLAFTACLRDQDLDVDDPDFSGGGAGGGGRGLFRGNLDRNDPEVQAAIETCRDEIPGFGGRLGGGGRG